ncbi:MAG: hypothetical protein ACO1OQ_10835 [Rufibacter sp.]
MNKFWKLTNLIVLSFLIITSLLGTFYKHISFGWGLGDIVGYALLYTTTIIHLILTIVLRDKRFTTHLFLTLFFFTSTVFIILQATVWRGSEYSWNGSIFYLPCPSKVRITNQGLEKELLIQMCSMDYYSEFTSTWDGQYMRIENGDILIPDELKKYLKCPIEFVEIQPYKLEIFENDSLSSYPQFKLDTLKKDLTYKLVGEIVRINNFTPVFEVTIKK